MKMETRESTHPDARREPVGLHAQAQTCKGAQTDTVSSNASNWSKDKKLNKEHRTPVHHKHKYKYIMDDWEKDQTSEVCPSKIVTSELGISQDWDAEVVAISIGSGPIKQIQRYFIIYIAKYSKKDPSS